VSEEGKKERRRNRRGEKGKRGKERGKAKEKPASNRSQAAGDRNPCGHFTPRGANFQRHHRSIILGPPVLQRASSQQAIKTKDNMEPW
jgi:hypothetical protein